VLTNHEIAAIDFLNRAVRGEAESTRAMEHYLKTGQA
jgi:hypothetical protein